MLLSMAATEVLLFVLVDTGRTKGESAQSTTNQTQVSFRSSKIQKEESYILKKMSLEGSYYGRFTFLSSSHYLW